MTKGYTFDEVMAVGFFYAPYIPLITTDKLYTPNEPQYDFKGQYVFAFYKFGWNLSSHVFYTDFIYCPTLDIDRNQLMLKLL